MARSSSRGGLWRDEPQPLSAAPLRGPATAGLGSLPTCGCDDTVNEAEAEGVMAMARLSKSSFGIPLEKDAEEVATVAAPAAGLMNYSRLLLGFGGRRDGGRWHEKRWNGLDEVGGRKKKKGGGGAGGDSHPAVRWQGECPDFPAH